MKFESLKQSLMQQIKPCYLIWGEDNFLLYKSLDLIEKTCNLSFSDFNLVVFDETSNFADIMASLEVLPMGDERRLVILKDIFAKAGKRGYSKEIDAINKYLNNPVPTTCLVLFVSSETEIYDGLQNIERVDCNKLSKEMLKKWVNASLKQADKTITAEALDTLIDYCNLSLTKINSELKKIIPYVGQHSEIVKSDILALTIPDAEYIIFELTDALSGKDGTTAHKIINKLLQGGESESNILSVITSYIRRLFFVSISNYSNIELAKMLNVKEYAIIKTKQQTKLFTKVALMGFYKLCEQVDYDIKRGAMQPQTALAYLINTILN